LQRQHKPPRFVLTLQTPANYPIRILRHALKRVWRDHKLRCVRIEETPNFVVIPMERQELERLKQFASTFRPRGGFGALFIKMNRNDGTWKKGKDNFDVTGHEFIADVVDALHGYQAFEDNKPPYHIGTISSGWHPPPVEELSGDGWRPVVLLPLYDHSSNATFIFTSQNKGGRDAVVKLIDAMADVYAGHPEDIGKLPVCILASDSYVNTHKKRIHVPIFETVGFVDRPADVHRIKPPAPALLAIEHNQELVDVTPAAKTTVSSKVARDMDDEIPF
jgi:hypothetical protein